MDLKWVYCPTCEVMTLICPECGNTPCTGTYGIVGESACKTCEEVNRLEDEAYRSGTVPVVDCLNGQRKSLSEKLDKMFAK